jgi:hypothetical protein
VGNGGNGANQISGLADRSAGVGRAVAVAEGGVAIDADGPATEGWVGAVGGAVGAGPPHALATRMTIAALTAARFRETPD